MWILLFQTLKALENYSITQNVFDFCNNKLVLNSI